MAKRKQQGHSPKRESTADRTIRIYEEMGWKLTAEDRAKIRRNWDEWDEKMRKRAQKSLRDGWMPNTAENRLSTGASGTSDDEFKASPEMNAQARSRMPGSGQTRKPGSHHGDKV